MDEETLPSAVSLCPSCQGPLEPEPDGPPKYITCSFCHQAFAFGEFKASGDGAMEAHSKILGEYNRAVTSRAIAAYAAAVAFAIVSAATILFAPQDRTVAANIIAGAFMALAMGIAGFTRFKAKAPGIEIDADRNSV
jgi:hypothetical protein